MHPVAGPSQVDDLETRLNFIHAIILEGSSPGVFNELVQVGQQPAHLAQLAALDPQGQLAVVRDDLGGVAGRLRWGCRGLRFRPGRHR
ncbi:hypothetical protein D3C83_50570 [compost metagenome]